MANGLHVFDTAIGRCGIGWSARGIATVQLPDRSDEQLRLRLRARLPTAEWDEPPPAVREAAARTARLLAGAHDDLQDLTLDMSGIAPFAQRVYARARLVGPGCTITYGQRAADVDGPGAAQAVGRALGANPFAPVVPCHRVLAAGWRAGGFSAPGGLATKLQLLQIERAAFGAPGLFD